MIKENSITKKESQYLAISALVLTSLFVFASDRYESFAYFYYLSLVLAALILRIKYTKNNKKFTSMIVHFVAYSLFLYFVILTVLLFTTDWGPN